MEEVLCYWFETLEPSAWFKQSANIDAQIEARFLATHAAITAGETEKWRATAQGRLAEIIVLDQFSRNMFRGTAAAFASDSLALALAQEAVRGKYDLELGDRQRPFVYMPYMHSESLLVHDSALKLFADTPHYSFEVRHREIIERFGRYPHRNQILSRKSTAAEIEWMENNSGF